MQNKDKKENIFSSTNFYTSCYLFCCGARLIDIDKTNPSKAKFIFEDSGDIESFIKEFSFAEQGSPKVMVDARDFVIAIKALKDKLYQKI